jgi:hypothetical protein
MLALQHVVHRRQIEVHLPGVLRPERPGLQVNNHKAPKPQMIEQQIDVEILVFYLDMVLAPDGPVPPLRPRSVFA